MLLLILMGDTALYTTRRKILEATEENEAASNTKTSRRRKPKHVAGPANYVLCSTEAMSCSVGCLSPTLLLPILLFKDTFSTD